MDSLFVNLSVLIIMATIVATILYRLRQPLILAYILTGVILGPIGLSWIKGQDTIKELASFGIALLLFLVGLELSVAAFKRLSGSAITLGLCQIAASSTFGYLLARLLDIHGAAAWYIGIALSFSSTIVIIKLLGERRELDTLSGRLTIGILLLQDAVAILALIIFSASASAPSLAGWSILSALIKLGLLVGCLYVLSSWVLPYLYRILARSSELLTISALGWCLLVAVTAQGLGLSLEIGAFLAGLSLASLPYNLEISARLRSLRDFFLAIFFISLGSQLTISGLSSVTTHFWLITLFVLIINPLIVILLMSSLGYRSRTNLSVALSFGMLSEFSIILLNLGLKLNQVTPELVALIIAVAAVSITVGTYFITHKDTIYRLLSSTLHLLERHDVNLEHSELHTPLKDHVILFGHHRLGEKFSSTLAKLKHHTLIVDYNPEIIHELKKQGKLCLYGDMSDSDVISKAGVRQALMVISTVPNLDDNLKLIKNIRSKKLKIPVYVTATSWADCSELYKAGADYVLFPHYLSGEHFSLMLKEATSNPKRIKADRIKHMKEMEHHHQEYSS